MANFMDQFDGMPIGTLHQVLKHWDFKVSPEWELCDGRKIYIKALNSHFDTTPIKQATDLREPKGEWLTYVRVKIK